MKGMRKAVRLLLIIVVASVILIPSFQLSDSRAQKTVYIDIAVYPSIVPAIKVLGYALQYGWNAGDTHYQFNVSEISMLEAMGYGKRPLNTDKTFPR